MKVYLDAAGETLAGSIALTARKDTQARGMQQKNP
jgi:hypothetical protein